MAFGVFHVWPGVRHSTHAIPGRLDSRKADGSTDSLVRVDLMSYRKRADMAVRAPIFNPPCGSRASARKLARWIYSSPPPFLLPPVVSPNWSIRLIKGRNKAITMLPTITARKTIMMGSNREVIAETALSTSSS